MTSSPGLGLHFSFQNKMCVFILLQIIWMNPKRILFARDEQRTIEDQRVSVTRPSNGDWNLRIAHVRYNDSGEYLCQINTSPVKIKRVYLYVQGMVMIGT